MHVRDRTLAVLLLGLWANFPTAAAAQVGTAEQRAPRDTVVALEGIVVTAQKREQRWIEVPVSVASLSGSDLRARQAETMTDLARLVPSVTFTPGINDLIGSMRVRGVGTVLFNQGVESSVSYVVDGVVLARQVQGFQDLVDVERIEVLRGPQGTLFGRNATAGLINIVTRRPAEQFGVEATGTIGQIGERRAHASITGPLGGDVTVRFTGFANEVGGHIANVATGADLNGGRSFGGRFQLRMDAGQSGDWLLIVDARRSEQECCQWQPVRADNPLYSRLLAPVVPSMDNRRVNVNAPLFNESDQWGASLQGEWRTGIGRVTSITGYRGWEFAANNDVDSTPTDAPRAGMPNGFGSFDVNRAEGSLRQLSQEVRLVSEGSGPWSYLLGLYALRVDVDRALTRRIGFCLPADPANAAAGAGDPCPRPSFQSRRGSASARDDSYAAFGQAEWVVGGPLRLLGGLRLQRDEVSYNGTRPAEPAPGFPGDGTLGPTFIGGPGASEGSGASGNTDMSGRVGAQVFLTRDAQAYLTYTRGYKGPGFDIEPTTRFEDQVPVRPETVDAFELGTKASLLGGGIAVGVAAFHQTYQDLQVQVSVESGGLRAFIPANAGRSVVRGVEVDLAAAPIAGLTLSGALAVLDAMVDVDGLACVPGASPEVLNGGAAPPENTCFRFTDEPATAARQNVRNGLLPNAPRYRGSASARYDATLAASGLRAFAQASVISQSEVSYSLEQNPLLGQAGYSVVDASVGTGDMAGRYTLSLFARNLFDRNYAAVLLNSPTWGATPIMANLNGFFPREARRLVGMSLRVSF